MDGTRLRLFFIFAIALLFLGGQFHLCADLNAGELGTKIAEIYLAR